MSKSRLSPTELISVESVIIESSSVKVIGLVVSDNGLVESGILILPGASLVTLICNAGAPEFPMFASGIVIISPSLKLHPGYNIWALACVFPTPVKVISNLAPMPEWLVV